MVHNMRQPMDADMEQCIENCLACHRTCEETTAYCTQMGGKHTEPERLRLLRDCAQSCITSADFMIRGSSFHPQVCGVCAQVCARCAESCEQFGDDAQMRACAEMCRRCSESCLQMAGTVMQM